MSEELSPVAMIVMGPPELCLACTFQQTCATPDPDGSVRLEHVMRLQGYSFSMGMATFVANMMTRRAIRLCQEHFGYAQEFLEGVGVIRREASSPEAKGQN